jgi:hypothetical protein
MVGYLLYVGIHDRISHGASLFDLTGCNARARVDCGFDPSWGGLPGTPKYPTTSSQLPILQADSLRDSFLEAPYVFACHTFWVRWTEAGGFKIGRNVASLIPVASEWGRCSLPIRLELKNSKNHAVSCLKFMSSTGITFDVCVPTCFD